LHQKITQTQTQTQKQKMTKMPVGVGFNHNKQIYACLWYYLDKHSRQKNRKEQTPEASWLHKHTPLALWLSSVASITCSEGFIVFEIDFHFLYRCKVN